MLNSYEPEMMETMRKCSHDNIFSPVTSAFSWMKLKYKWTIFDLLVQC